jgi:hypothetical protein
MTDNSIPAWDRLGGMAIEAARRGDTQRAYELGLAARDAWLGHCEAVHAQELARGRIPSHSVWTRDEERER